VSEHRTAMIAALKRTVVPALRARGFKGSFPHFRRPGSGRIDLLTFQFDKWGGGFVVEIAKCSREGHNTHLGTLVPPTKVTAQDVNRRLRLGAAQEGDDHWFRFDGLDPISNSARYDAVAAEVLPHLDSQGETWWRDA